MSCRINLTLIFKLFLGIIATHMGFAYAVDLDQYRAEIKALVVSSKEKASKYTEEVTKLQDEHVKKLQRSVPGLNSSANVDASTTATTAEKYLFVSFSIPEKNLQELIMQAKKQNFIPVLRGFKDGSYVATTNALAKIVEETSYGVIIDPNLFREFGIEVVPSFVIASSENICPANTSCPRRKYNKLAGNVTVSYALETLLNKGDSL